MLPYTSGTTGLPKGCMHLHSQHHAQRRRQFRSGATGTAENVMLLVVPMFHITGMVSMMHTNIYIGAHAGDDAALGPRRWPAA